MLVYCLWGQDNFSWSSWVLLQVLFVWFTHHLLCHFPFSPCAQVFLLQLFSLFWHIWKKCDASCGSVYLCTWCEKLDIGSVYTWWYHIVFVFTLSKWKGGDMISNQISYGFYSACFRNLFPLWLTFFPGVWFPRDRVRVWIHDFHDGHILTLLTGKEMISRGGHVFCVTCDKY